MEKLTSLILLLSLLFITGASLFDQKEDEKLLTANMAAALRLENKYLTTCGDVQFDFRPARVKAPLFDGLGSHTFTITGADKEAQQYFNQGLNRTYGFNHAEAHRSFKEASVLAESSPMTYWAQAYAVGPNINDSQPGVERLAQADEYLTKAISLLDKASDMEKALIQALRLRFVKAGDNLQLDNEAYMNEMGRVAKKFKNHADVQTLYAAAIMNTMPWNYWEPDLTPRPNTKEAMEALGKAIEINPVHPGAHHYSIHLYELPDPDKAAKSGDVLAPLMPGAGHMVHMPSHAYIRVGRYKDAAESNLKAVEADETYISQCYSQGLYPLGYYAHNIHFIWSAATMMGDSETALAAARKTSEKVSVGQLDQNVYMQEFAAIPLQAYVRFGKWNDILTVPYPGNNLKHLKIFWHYGRGIAFIRKGILIEAQEELDSLKRMMDDQANESIYATINSSSRVVEIAYHIVAAELSAAQGEVDQADASFRNAMTTEDKLLYYEPATWHLPTRLNYGNFLISQKQYEKAAAIYQEDLKTWRNNGWALIGLYNAYQGMGEKEKADKTMENFKEAWQYADVEIKNSVY